MDNVAKSIDRYSIEEYYEIVSKTSKMTELVNGEIVDMASPSILHQEIVGGLYFELKSYIKANNGRCKTFMAPTDVKLNDNTIVIPDVFITCKPENFDSQKYNGSPEFVVEVVSTNRFDDFSRKLAIYQENGVREYWIVDPKNQKTLVYFFEESLFPCIYTFDEPIPVNIYKGNLIRLEITISEILG